MNSFIPVPLENLNVDSKVRGGPSPNAPHFRCNLQCIWTAVCLIGLATLGCHSPGDAADSHHGHQTTISIERKFAGPGPIKITCTTGMVADVARHVGGEFVELRQLMGEGVDPHLYKASPGDIRILGTADVVLYSGLHLEGKMGDLFGRIGRHRPAFGVADFFPEDRVLMLDEGARDPHVWFDVSLWRRTVDTIRDVLAEFDPPHAQVYRSNAARYGAILDALHEEVKVKLAQIPKERRVLVTAHDAFQYFGRAYGIEVEAIQGISTESEAGVYEINKLVDFMVARKIKAIFVESSVSDRNIMALIEGCKARKHEVKTGGELFSDAMGKAGTPDGTYEGMIRHNVDTIVSALR